MRSSDGLTPDGLSVLSLMNFDIDDANALLDQGVWDDLVLHAMFHAMGFGSPLWSAETLSPSFAGVEGQFFTFNWLSSGTAVVEIMSDEGRTGLPKLNGQFLTADFVNVFSTFDGHWDEFEFGNSLMTPTMDTE